MMLARKQDRLTEIWGRIEFQTDNEGYNIFDAIAMDEREEGILDDIRDLRCYLILVEAEAKRLADGQS